MKLFGGGALLLLVRPGALSSPVRAAAHLNIPRARAGSALTRPARQPALVAAALAGIGLIVWQMTVHHNHLYDISASQAAHCAPPRSF